MNKEGEWITAEEDIQKEAVSDFQNKLNGSLQATGDELLKNIPHLLSAEQNAELILQPTLAELKEAIDSMNEDSATGADGYNGYFYSSCWDVIKNDLFDDVCEFFAGFEMPRSWTSTLIIPMTTPQPSNN